MNFPIVGGGRLRRFLHCIGWTPWVLVGTGDNVLSGVDLGYILHFTSEGNKQ